MPASLGRDSLDVTIVIKATSGTRGALSQLLASIAYCWSDASLVKQWVLETDRVGAPVSSKHDTSDCFPLPWTLGPAKPTKYVAYLDDTIVFHRRDTIVTKWIEALAAHPCNKAFLGTSDSFACRTECFVAEGWPVMYDSERLC